MSSIKEISYGETFNTGNFESVRIGVTVTVLGKDTPEKAIEGARRFVRREFRKMKDSGIKGGR